MENKPDFEKHSPLPWTACHDGNCSCGMIFSNAIDCAVAAALSTCRNYETYNLGEGLSPTSEQLKANTKFIVEACNSYYSLKQQIEEKDKEIERLKAMVKEV